MATTISWSWGGDAAGWLAGGPETRSTAGWQAHFLGTGQNVETGDINGDERRDLVLDRGDGLGFALGDPEGLGNQQPILGIDLAYATDLGDVNGDGYDDLVGRSIGKDNHTWVSVLFGSRAGFDAEHALRFDAGDVDISGSDPDFAWDVAVADVNRDGRAEIAIGVPGAEVGGVEDAGSVVVVVVPGGTDGPVTAAAKTFTQGSVSESGNREKDDWFGDRVEYRDLLPATGPELLIGSSGEDAQAGKVQLIGSDGAVRQFRPQDAGIDPSHAHFGDG